MNKNQKILFLFSLLAILGIIIYWFMQGAEIFTKTKVLIDQTSELDKMLGVKNEVWVDKFILGLDYSAVAIVIILILTIILNNLLKNKQKES